MSTFGRTITIFLVDGTTTGIRIGEIGNRSIKAVYVPRGAIEAFADREEAKRTGVYLLVGDGPSPSRLRIYVGEGDDVLQRIVAHNGDPKKDWWGRVIVFVSADANLTKAHVRHLEARLVDLATSAHRCEVENKTEPGGGTLPERDRSLMAEFLDQIQTLLATFGVEVLTPVTVPLDGAVQRPARVEGGVVLTLRGDGFAARCVLRNGEFVVLEGSFARVKQTPSVGEGAAACRSELSASGVLVRDADRLRFTQDWSFGTASAAAQVVVGASINGRTAWKLDDGTTFADWQAQRLGRGDGEPMAG
jgi:hypothetical protein